MKKLKWILLFIMILFAIIFLFATCKKTNALQSGFYGTQINIAEHSQSDYNVVFIYDFGLRDNRSSEFLQIDGINIYCNINQQNVLTIHNSINNTNETVNLTSRLLQLQVVEDTNQLYLIVYELNYTVQVVQGVEPVIDGIQRTLKTRYLLPTQLYNKWISQNGLNMIISASDIWAPYFLVNYSYIDYSETPTDINDWVNSQLSNYITYNKLIHQGYLAGNEDGYLDGFEDGEDRGYSDGYDAGEQAGYNNGYYTGRTEGLAEGEQIGYNEGYNVGYTDGQAGNTAITPVFNTLSGVFSVVGTVLAIELVPHIPLGIFILVPLFFAAVGLILWIWRRN